MEIADRWSQTKRNLNNWKSVLTEQKGARDQLVRVRDAETKKLIEFQDQQRITHLAQLFLLSEITERRQEAIESIEKMSTVALQMVYGKGYALKFNTYEEKRKEGAANFKMDINILSPFGDDVLITGLKGERGGGVVEIVAFALRMAALNWLNYDGPIVLDEAYKSMSNDDKLKSVAAFIREITDYTDRQVIFATHRAEVFGKVANQVIKVSNTDGLSSCEIGHEDITDDFE